LILHSTSVIIHTHIKLDDAIPVGELFDEMRLKSDGIVKLTFDRGGYLVVHLNHIENSNQQALKMPSKLLFR
jgi:hypothetical protein